MTMPPKKDPPKTTKSLVGDVQSEEPCGCGKCEKAVQASACHLLCFSCQCPVLAACLGMSVTVHSFISKSPNILFVCDSCKCESVPASAELTELKATVDRIAQAVCPQVVAKEQNDPEMSEEAAGEEAGQSWTVVGRKKQKRRSYAHVASSQTPFCQAVAETVSLAIEERDKEELQKRTIVVENCPQNSDIDDMCLAIELCQQIHSNITVLGVHRMRPLSLPKATAATEKKDTSKTTKARPPILKLFLRSPTDKALALRHKSNLQYGNDWMQTSSVRPSLPLEERQRRDQLSQVVKDRNGSNSEKDNRFLVWLNPRSEKYELRQIKDGEWVKSAEVKKPTDAEMAAANAAIEKRQKGWEKKLTGSKNVK